MGNELQTFNPELESYQRRAEVIKSQIAKGATDDEFAMFMTIANKYGLDPMIKEIWFVKRAKKQKDKAGNWDYPRLANGEINYKDADTMILASRDGFLKIAQRDPNFQGIISMAVREGDDFEIDIEHYNVKHKFGAKRGKIVGAYAKVDRAGRNPVITWAEFSEYNDERSAIWKQYATAMIIKVAEVQALKRQFGITGIISEEELGREQKEYTSVINEEGIEVIDPSETITCEDCSKEVANTPKMNYKEVAEYSKNNFGRVMCSECAIKEFEKRRAAQKAGEVT
jgi:phage recombination protein Bet